MFVLYIVLCHKEALGRPYLHFILALNIIYSKAVIGEETQDCISVWGGGGGGGGEYSKMVRCAVTLDTSFAQCWNRKYRMVNKTTLLNSVCIIPLRTNVNN